MLQKFAKAFGVVFVAIGILGFIPAFAPDHKLLGIFEIGTVHNLIHLSSGLVALATGFSSEYASRKYFQIFGIVYGLVTVLGVFYGNNAILGIVDHNIADIFLHAAITASTLYLGFGYRDRGVHTTTV